MLVPPVAGVMGEALTVWVTVWVAAVRKEVTTMVALLPERVTAPSKLVPSSVNWTVPVRVPAPGETGLTVAVKVTGSPAKEGLADEATVVVVLALLTVWARLVEVLALKLVSPL